MDLRFGPLSAEEFRSIIEDAIENLIKKADAKVNWRKTNTAISGGEDAEQQEVEQLQPFIFLAGVYVWSKEIFDESSSKKQTEQQQEEEKSGDIADPEDFVEEDIEPKVACRSKITLVLHANEENSFEYYWTQEKNSKKKTLHDLKILGHWRTPVLNRNKFGDHDEQVFLDCKKVQFSRCTNLDEKTGKWKQILNTIPKHGEDWVYFGDNDRGLPPMTISFYLENSVLKSNGNVTVDEIIGITSASRTLAGLTKKTGKRLGNPIDVVTDEWLPKKDLVFTKCDHPVHSAVVFNPLICLAEYLRTKSPSAVKRDLVHQQALQYTRSQSEIAISQVTKKAAIININDQG